MEYLSPKDGGLLRFKAKPAFSLVLLLCSISSQAAPVPVVRVMVEREKSTITLNGFDLVIREAETERRVGMAGGRTQVGVKCSLGGRVSVELERQKLPVSGPLHITSLGGFIRVGESQYRDDLYIYSFNGDCIVINHVDLEKYVAGLLNSEMSASWSLPTLMAQAVAARTYAIHQMKESSTTRFQGLKPPFDVEGTVRDQVYEGAHKERYRPLRAVQATRGQVLTYKGIPIKAFYHSTCGGRTETPERVWGSRLPYMKAVNCGNCGKSPRFNWVYSVGLSELEQKLQAQRLLKGKLISVRVVDRNSMGRANRIEVHGSLGMTMVAAPRIRDMFGTVKLKSTDFNVAKDGEKFVFVGHGSGHGVGMCQWGAKGMGDHSYTYAQILKHYYPMADLTRLY